MQRPNGFVTFKELVVVAFLLLVYSALVLGLSGCVSLSVGNEPEFVSTIYTPSVSGACEFENSENPMDVIKCGDARMQKMYLTPISELDKLNQKFDRCAKWR